jgi:Tfp pilus assembly protein PilV
MTRNMNIPRSRTVTHHPRAGLSLLEVLVACGVLAIGLASVAAILPAASSRFGQAQLADRAGFLAANARADLLNRGVVAADVFASGTRACAFGQVASALLTISATATGTTGRTWPTFAATASDVLDQRIDTAFAPILIRQIWTGTSPRIPTIPLRGRGFLLEDDLKYLPPSGAETPRNSFMPSSTTGPRTFEQSMFWGATLWPSGTTTAIAAPGVPAVLSVAVFRRPGDACEFRLTRTGTISPSGPETLRCEGVLRSGDASTLQTGTAAALPIEAGRLQYLSPCSFVLALTSPPQWARVASSWTLSGTMVSGTENVNSRRSFVVLEPAPQFTGTTIRVVGFDGLLRVDQHPVTLE